MSRWEKIREHAHWLANRFSTRHGYSSIEDCLIEMAKFVDNNQPNPWVSAKENKPEAVEQKEFGHRRLSKQVLAMHEDGKCHVVRYDYDCQCWRWANGYGQMFEPKMWRYIDIPEGGIK